MPGGVIIPGNHISALGQGRCAGMILGSIPHLHQSNLAAGIPFLEDRQGNR
jgi:hypothetical protein